MISQNPCVKDWNEWIKSHSDLCDATTLKAPASSSYYLTNRIQRAFHEAYELGRKAEREAILQKLKIVLTSE